MIPVEEYITKGGKKLRLGYTTGSCAAAASKAAAWMLLTGRKKDTVRLLTPKGIELSLTVLQISMGQNWVSCAIEKDSGDDPDITRGVLITARVSCADVPGIHIDGGAGVGRVTKPGLDQPIGAAAINSAPRKMICENLEEVCLQTGYHGGLNVEISVPDGALLAEKTFNPRLGITGGISILGTTGIVEPMSEQALVDTIRTELRQRRASGSDYVLLTPGNYGAEFIRDSLSIDPARAILTSNFIGEALDICSELGFQGALLVGHAGKLVKLAGGMMNTHSKYGDCRMEIIASHAGAAGLPPASIQAILDCVTCDEAIQLLKDNGVYAETLSQISTHISLAMERRVMGHIQTGAIWFSKKHGFLSATEHAYPLLKLIGRD